MVPDLFLAEEFRRRYPHSGKPCIVHSPGRVDLLGSHNDYNGLPVLTITLDRAISIAFAPREDSQVRFENVDAAFEPVEFALESPIPRSTQGHWANYLKAAAHWLVSNPDAERQFCGIDGLVASDLPMGQGLSSSSALVVGSALTLLTANEIHYERLNLAEEMARAEHYVGTAGGGMDQASCLLGMEGHALRLDFFPLRARPQQIPPGYDFLLVDTLIRTAKTREHLDTFNRRVVECRLAAAVLAHALEVEYDPSTTLLLGQLPVDVLEVSEKQLNDLLNNTFPKETFTLSEIAARIGISSEDAEHRWLVLPGGRTFTPPADGFRLLQRSRHILTEARRVLAATDFFARGQADGLAGLIAQGYASSRDNYEVSLPAVETIIERCHEAGIHAARLPGAGFGGSLVCVAPRGTADEARRRIYELFYSKADPRRFPPGQSPEALLKDTCFQVVPSHGAAVVEP